MSGNLDLEDRVFTNSDGQMSIFSGISKHFKKKHEEPKTEVSETNSGMSRRDFLKTSGTLGVGTAVFGVSGLLNQLAAAGGPNLSHLPPAFQNLDNHAIVSLWLRKDNREVVERLLKGGEYGGESLKKEDFLTEPALYLAIAFSGKESSRYAKEHLRSNNPLLKFSEFIDNYAKKYVWDNKKYSNIQDMETPAIQSLALSADLSCDSTCDQYLKGDLSIKKDVISTIRRNVQKMSKQNQIIAQYTSTWLTNHYNHDHNVPSEYINLTYEGLEKPLRKNTLKVRGPPYYLKNKLA